VTEIYEGFAPSGYHYAGFRLSGYTGPLALGETHILLVQTEAQIAQWISEAQLTRWKPVLDRLNTAFMTGARVEVDYETTLQPPVNSPVGWRVKVYPNTPCQ